MPPIKKSNRKYKKDEPFRDARKFILICEGEREAKREPTGFEIINVLNLCQHQKGVCR